MPEISKHIPDNLTLARSKLNQCIKSFYQNKKVQIKIIYDGKSGIINETRHGQKVDIRFSKDPEKADHLIIAFLARESKPSIWTVVTSDRDLTLAAKNLGTQVISSEAFLVKLNSRKSINDEYPSKSHPNMNKDELDYWLGMFKD
jgi:predicted RNA-binding protein with PIN domain